MEVAYRLLALVLGTAGAVCFYGAVWFAFNREIGPVLWCGFFYGIAGGLYAGADHLSQRAKFNWSSPLAAQNAYNLAKRSTDFSFAMYLRPLKSDAVVRTFDTHNPFRWVLPGFGMPFIEIQEWLMQTAPNKWRFLSDGGICSNIRPVAILDSGDWFEDVKLVGEAMDVIILLPGPTQGVQAEFDYFLHRCPTRIIVLAPPRRDNDQYFSLLALTSRPEAKAVLEADKSGEFLIPERDAQGDLTFAHMPFSRRSYLALLNQFGRRAMRSAT